MVMEFLELVKARRSVRTYSNRTVEDEKIQQILESARLAPSWANKQCWSFIMVKDRDKAAAVSKTAGIANRWITNAPVIIVACGDPGKSGSRGGITYYAVDVAIALEHLVLAATELGLGTCWIGYFDEKKVKDILGIPERIRVVALMPVGYPAERAGLHEGVTRLVVRSKNRKDLEEIVHYDAW
jgi:nitroreductase